MSSSWMVVLFAAVVGLVAVFAFNAPSDARPKEASKQYAVTKSDQDWKKTLTRQQFRILRQKGTERAFTGEYWNEKRKGLYRCAGCNQPLFHSDHKFKSGTGWPSYYKAVAPGLVETETDTAYGMVRTEILCSRCGGHLGHVFRDGPRPTGLRYCVNSASLKFEPGASASVDAPKSDTNKAKTDAKPKS